MSKKIAILTQFFYPENVTTANLALQTAKSLSDEGIDVTVITGKSKIYNNQKKIKRKEKYEGINIERIRYLNFKRKSKLFRLISYLSFTISFYINIFKLKKFDTIMIYSSPPILPKVAILANKLFKTKIIFVSYDIYPEIAVNMGAIKKDGLIYNNTKKMNRKLFKRVSKVIALSNEMKKFILDNRTINENKVEVIPNWHEDILKQTREVNNDNNVIVSYFGNLGILQDIYTIIESSKVFKNDDIKFLFAGHGVKIEKLLEEKKNNELNNVHFLGYLSGEDYKDALAKTDVFIVSLLSEGTSLAVPSKTYSYYMAGKPIIAIIDKSTDIAKEIIENNIGFVVQPNDIEGFNNVIFEIINKRENLLEMGKNARNLYEKKYKPEIVLKQYVKLVKSVMEE